MPYTGKIDLDAYMYENDLYGSQEFFESEAEFNEVMEANSLKRKQETELAKAEAARKANVEKAAADNVAK